MGGLSGCTTMHMQRIDEQHIDVGWPECAFVIHRKLETHETHALTQLDEMKAQVGFVRRSDPSYIQGIRLQEKHVV